MHFTISRPTIVLTILAPRPAWPFSQVRLFFLRPYEFPLSPCNALAPCHFCHFTILYYSQETKALPFYHFRLIRAATNFTFYCVCHFIALPALPFYQLTIYATLTCIYLFNDPTFFRPAAVFPLTTRNFRDSNIFTILPNIPLLGPRPFPILPIPIIRSG